MAAAAGGDEKKDRIEWPTGLDEFTKAARTAIRGKTMNDLRVSDRIFNLACEFAWNIIWGKRLLLGGDTLNADASNLSPVGEFVQSINKHSVSKSGVVK